MAHMYVIYSYRMIILVAIGVSVPQRVFMAPMSYIE